jgi:hypothetical protein
MLNKSEKEFLHQQKNFLIEIFIYSIFFLLCPWRRIFPLMEMEERMQQCAIPLFFHFLFLICRWLILINIIHDVSFHFFLTPSSATSSSPSTTYFFSNCKKNRRPWLLKKNLFETTFFFAVVVVQISSNFFFFLILTQAFFCLS